MADEKTTFRGLRTVIYGVPDLAQAKEWYANAFGTQPYFDQPFYVGFNIGGYELGLHPDHAAGAGGVTAYWGVGDAEATVKRMESAGATVSVPVHDVGDGIKVATLLDPFGNQIGVIENPHFDPKATT